MIPKVPKNFRDMRRGEAVVVRIYEIDIPLPSIDPEVLKAHSQVPIYQPGIVAMGGKGAAVTTAGGQPGQVVAGFAVGFNGGQALIIRETAFALEEIRSEIDVLRKGLRVSLHVNEQLATQAQIGQDGATATRLREIGKSVKELREALFPDDPLPPPETDA
jgi:hypothetical protein